jgi:hypothetical protein
VRHGAFSVRKQSFSVRKQPGYFQPFIGARAGMVARMRAGDGQSWAPEVRHPARVIVVD